MYDFKMLVALMCILHETVLKFARKPLFHRTNLNAKGICYIISCTKQPRVRLQTAIIVK